jgi:hypothetical protein
MVFWEITTFYFDKHTKLIKQALDEIQSILTLKMVEDRVTTGR